MTSFKELFPNYETLHSDSLFYNELPTAFIDGFTGLIIKHVNGSTNTLKRIVNIVLSNIPDSPTGNWGFDFIQNDLIDSLYRISKKPFHKIMDTIQQIVDEIEGHLFTDDLNEYLEESKIGYRIEEKHFGKYWIQIESIDTETQNIIKATIPTLREKCEQTYQHIQQLEENLKSGTTRSDKDALRDALSAMEALLKNVTKTNDIKDATNVLKSEINKWGPHEISKDGLSIWNKIHELYPDVRHGNPIVTTIDNETILYWIERLLVFIRYIIKKI